MVELPDGLRRFAWVGFDDTPGADAVLGYQIRYSALAAATWADSIPLHTGTLSAGPLIVPEPEAGTWTFRIRAVHADRLGEVAATRLTLGSPPTGRGVRWRGPWASGTEYLTQDAVSHEGHSYVTSKDHTAADDNAPSGTDEDNDCWAVYAARGFAGEDGNGVEDIFTKTSTPNLAASRRPSNAWGYDDPGTAGGQVWLDGAPGLDETDAYLWRASRVVPGQPDVGAVVDADFGSPVIVGRFGPAGVDGTDGVIGADGEDGQPGEDGLSKERIFARTATANSPTAPI